MGDLSVIENSKPSQLNLVSPLEAFVMRGSWVKVTYNLVEKDRERERKTLICFVLSWVVYVHFVLKWPAAQRRHPREFFPSIIKMRRRRGLCDLFFVLETRNKSEVASRLALI